MLTYFILIRKHLILEVTEEFVRDYNKASPTERIKQNEIIYRMLQRLKVRRSRVQNRYGSTIPICVFIHDTRIETENYH